jgi:hypothetical protein
MELPGITRLNPNHVLMFEMALKHLEHEFPAFHPLELAHAMEQRSHQLRIEAAEQVEIEAVNFAAKNLLA